MASDGLQPERLVQIARFQQLIDDGQLRIGMLRAEVKALLGEPDKVGCTSRRYPTPSCFKYGEVELFFGPRAGDGLTMVFSEDAEGENGAALPFPPSP